MVAVADICKQIVMLVYNGGDLSFRLVALITTVFASIVLAVLLNIRKHARIAAYVPAAFFLSCVAYCLVGDLFEDGPGDGPGDGGGSGTAAGIFAAAGLGFAAAGVLSVHVGALRACCGMFAAILASAHVLRLSTKPMDEAYLKGLLACMTLATYAYTYSLNFELAHTISLVQVLLALVGYGADLMVSTGYFLNHLCVFDASHVYCLTSLALYDQGEVVNPAITFWNFLFLALAPLLAFQIHVRGAAACCDLKKHDTIENEWAYFDLLKKTEVPEIEDMSDFIFSISRKKKMAAWLVRRSKAATFALLKTARRRSQRHARIQNPSQSAL